jgi:hypothetical protein
MKNFRTESHERHGFGVLMTCPVCHGETAAVIYDDAKDFRCYRCHAELTWVGGSEHVRINSEADNGLPY